MYYDQNTARKSFEEYLKNSGQKVRFIADKIGCHETTICHWRKGRNMRTGLYIRLVKYLLNNKAKLL